MAPQDRRPEGEDAPVPCPVLDVAVRRWKRVGKVHAVRVSGSSMLPLLRDGDLVTLQATDACPCTGDIVVFRDGDRLIVHRVLRVVAAPGGPLLRTKGDNCTACDAPVRPGEVLGRVTAFRRGSRRYRLDTPTVRLASTAAAWGGLAIAALFGLGRRLAGRFPAAAGSPPFRAGRRAALFLASLPTRIGSKTT